MKKGILAVVILVLLGTVFYYMGFWYDLAHYLKFPGYGMPRVYCDPGPCQPVIKYPKATFSDNEHIEFEYDTNWKVGGFAHYPGKYTVQPVGIFTPEATEKSILIDVMGHCMNTQCLSIYSLDDMVENLGAKVVGKVEVKNSTGYEVLLPDPVRGENYFRGGYMFIRGKDFIFLSTDVYSDYLAKIIPTLKLLASQ